MLTFSISFYTMPKQNKHKEIKQMLWGYTYDSNSFLSVKKQREVVSTFAPKHQFTPLRFRTLECGKEILKHNFQGNDIIIVPDVVFFGTKFEEIISALKILSEKKVKICSASENLMFDNPIPVLSYGILDSCLKIYKGTLSFKNKQIQAKLLENGRKKRPPPKKRIRCKL